MAQHNFKHLNSIFSSLGITAPSYEKSGRGRLKKNTSEELFDFLSLIKHWEEIVGQRIAQNSIPLKLTKGTLTILTDHSAYSSMVSFLDEKIRTNITEMFPMLRGKIDNIKFQVNSAHFSEQQAKFINICANNQKRQSSFKMHSQSPEYKRLKKEADALLAQIEDCDLKETLTSIFLQNRDSKK
ncbi:MAG: hypothetical protein A2504_16170 [Bdellovibrionales bacterium RIFOXYD12_FULL_39_22]|nr:MAG: hypothetical protein A2385_08080 [Bdellovibrionales bacterium RIFOXYB1_FULL_39_21]OFZ42984.1 MAG: hypothetical protein A2485_11145 [Bdellovibrionales bacterium RIFOXYC12_FULL_39_17]OFZ50930.1 MAG: hypothetical protein A2404_06995 [Bdellovibrionales bacterium RIFOXYC1_FULL_39_130]OFZ74066.1 MAG: hypothetical protein A2451_12175 [Bdellovibrionales bacterium RIFOXYC2_FULL_39_8]OFZ78153.1 MAG: hypothetical protein A2560_02165 [Bdellovibrionales bacterium RIFOXYD1_FULL_39_84]OFZ94021.1 MAG: